jgi:hypothetical protein
VRKLIAGLVGLAIIVVGALVYRSRSSPTPDSSNLVPTSNLAADGNFSQPMIEMRVNNNIDDILQNACGLTPAKAHDLSIIAGFHDVQQLPTAPTSIDYGPDARIYSCDRKRTLAEFQAGTVVAVMHVIGATTGMTTYDNIGLDASAPAFKCMWVDVQLNDWFWEVGSVTDNRCDRPSTINRPVVRTQVSGNQLNYPAGVRFVDTEGLLPRVGVPCVDHWCEMGKAPDAYTPGDSPSGSIADQVKGWHDEQKIAERPGGPGTAIKRGTRARVTPIPNLAGVQPDEYVTPGQGGIIGVKLATVKMSGPPTGKYSSIWGIGNGLSSLWVRRVNTTGGVQYQAQFTPGMSSTPNPTGQWFVVQHSTHTEIQPIPGVARWLWDANDEEIWLACEQGCCEITSGNALVPTGPAAPSPSAPRGPRH